MKLKSILVAILTASTSFIPLSNAMAAEDVIIVYDASGSMWGQIDGVSKIEIARNVMADLVESWSPDTSLGLVAYGHRRDGDCTDIETLIEPAPLKHSSFISVVNSIQPKGKTPISAAVQHAAEALSYRDNPATVVLISDGLETCQADPCALAAQLKKQGTNFTAHVVGFDLENDAHDQLACIAENTGGIFVPAQNAAELKDALAHVQNAMDLKPLASAHVEPAAVEELAVDTISDINLTVPTQATTGARFNVAWSGSSEPEDYVTIVPVGADEGTHTDYVRVRDKSEDKLTAPSEDGVYEVRYVSNKGARTLSSSSIEIIAAEVDLSAPGQVTTGANFNISWTASIHPEDYITIVHADAEPGTHTSYIRVRDALKGKLTAPAEAGLYEVRYVLNKGAKTLAATPVEVVAAEVNISSPEHVTTGANFKINWSVSIHPEDYITIVPAGADEGAHTSYIRVREALEGKLTAPAEAGLYEVRYVLNKGAKTLAAIPVEVVAAEVGVSSPEQVTTGASFKVNWTTSVHPEDYVTIVAAGAGEGTHTKYIRVKEAHEGKLTAPAEAGLYEVRYVLNKGAKTLAMMPIEVTEAEVGIAGPATVRAGRPVRVTWSSAINSNDYVTIVPVGSDEGAHTQYARVRDSLQADLKSPAEAGLYEVRYVLNEGARTLARYDLEVVDADAPLDAGGGLVVPERAAQGEIITVSWTGGSESKDQRIVLAKADQPDFSWISAQPIGEQQTINLKMPAESGMYEVRYLDVTARKLLGRAIIKVE